MSEDTLQDIIETERQIYRTLQEEKQKASRWLAEQKKKIDAELQERMAEFSVSGCRHQDAVEKEARSISAKRIAAARQQMERFENIPDTSLEQVIKKYLHTILPKSS